VNVFVVIPVHNRLHLTRACLAALDGQTFRDFSVVVVDDGSTDGTSEALEREFPAVVVLHGDGSLWWTGAMNVGVSWALQQASDTDTIVSLNDDTIPPPDYLGRLVAAQATRPGALIGSLLVSAADRRTIVDGGVRIHWPTAKYSSNQAAKPLPPDRPSYPDLYSVDVLSGCGTAIPVETFRTVGTYDARGLRHYGADYEFSCRARATGFPLYVDRASILYLHEHETGIHAAAEGRDLSTLLRSFWDIRSANDLRLRWRFARRACPRRWLPTYVPCDYARVVVGSLRRHRQSRRRVSV